jgi:hypothetical protein
MPGVTVRAREKYYWPEKEKVETGPPPPPLARSISGVLPDADVPMRATAAAFAAPNGQGATVAAVTSVRVTPVDAPVSSLETFGFAVRAFTAEGDPRGEITSEPSIRHVGRDVEAEVLSEMGIEKPGLYQLRIAAHRAKADLNGSVYLTVEVPDFRKQPVSFSGAVLSTASWPGLGLKEEMAALIPVKPTIDREFSPGLRVRAFVRVYQGGNGRLIAVSPRIRIVDDHDQVVLDRTELLPPSRFTVGRGADLLVDLPVSTLVPGQYLLTFEATLGKTRARREVRFSIK